MGSRAIEIGIVTITRGSESEGITKCQVISQSLALRGFSGFKPFDLEAPIYLNCPSS